MTDLVFLLEEESMKRFLSGILDKIIPAERFNIKLLVHEGKSHLKKSIPFKLRGWHSPAIFIILMDQDNKDCHALKQELLTLCPENIEAKTLVRIVCQELEAWYLGDKTALSKAFPDFRRNCNKAVFRKPPESIRKPSALLKQNIKGFRKGAAADRMPQFMKIDQNQSKSFQVFVAGLQRLISYGEFGKGDCKRE